MDRTYASQVRAARNKKKNSTLEAKVQNFLSRFSTTHSDDFSESGSGPYGSQKYESQVGNPRPSSEVSKTLVQPFFGMISTKLIDASICMCPSNL